MSCELGEPASRLVVVGWASSLARRVSQSGQPAGWRAGEPKSGWWLFSVNCTPPECDCRLPFRVWRRRVVSNASQPAIESQAGSQRASFSVVSAPYFAGSARASQPASWSLWASLLPVGSMVLAIPLAPTLRQSCARESPEDWQAVAAAAMRQPRKEELVPAKHFQELSRLGRKL